MAISLRLGVSPSDEDIRRLAAHNPGYQFERTAGGELVVTPTGGRAGRCEAELITQLSNWANADGTGLVFSSSTGFLLLDGSLLVPDASWVRRDRWEALGPEAQEGFVPLCPEAVFEVVSPSDSLTYLRRKSRDYIANGARLVVLVDPKRRAVEVHVPDQAPRVLEPAEHVSFGTTLPGFTLDLQRIFE
jgi:Uma2 family endonuclease